MKPKTFNLPASAHNHLGEMMMNRSAVIALFAVACGMLAASGAGAQAVQPGEWTMTTRILSMEGTRMPPAMAAAMKEPKTNQVCVTPEKAAQGFRASMQNATDCQSKSMTISGGVLDAEGICKEGGGTRTMHFHGPYSPTAYNLNVQVSKTGPRPTTMTMTMVAKRTGPCH